MTSTKAVPAESLAKNFSKSKSLRPKAWSHRWSTCVPSTKSMDVGNCLGAAAPVVSDTDAAPFFSDSATPQIYYLAIDTAIVAGPDKSGPAEHDRF